MQFYSAGIAVGLVAILFVLRGIKSNYDELTDAVTTGNVQVVEGIVEDFHPMPVTGHDTERFTIGTWRFEYSDYDKSGGFNNTASHGGPIKPGLPVRITFVREPSRNVIVKLEIRRT